jgi:hypothetical protein
MARGIRHRLLRRNNLVHLLELAGEVGDEREKPSPDSSG